VVTGAPAVAPPNLEAWGRGIAGSGGGGRGGEAVVRGSEVEANQSDIAKQPRS